MTDWTKTQREFEAQPAGSIFQDAHDEYWFKPEQSEAYHLDFCVVNLLSGKIIHFSKMGQPIKPVYGFEVRW